MQSHVIAAAAMRRARVLTLVLTLGLLGAATCASGRAPPAGGGSAGGAGGGAGAQASEGDAAGPGPGGNQGHDADSRAGGGGNSGGTAGGGGTGGGSEPADASAGDASAFDAVAMEAGASGQGPVAEGRIVFSQDFESGMEGITRSPTNLPPERAQIADDPLGQRGKVMKIVWQAGDNFMTNGGSTHTRSWISNTGYSFPVGTTVNFAWGYMTSSSQIDAAFAQSIRPGGPMWLIEGNGDGSTYVNCRSCGGQAPLPVKLMPNRWYDLRVEMTYANGGPIRFFIDGAMVLERKMTVNDPPGQRAHWDGGIYNHAAGTTTRTVYISNLSVGTK
jgi:hypothetical protein